MTGRPAVELGAGGGEKRRKLTCRADIVQDGVRPNLRIDGFDKGGHFDGGAALALPCRVSRWIDDGFNFEIGGRGWLAGKEFGVRSARTPIPAASSLGWDDANKQHSRGDKQCSLIMAMA